MIISVVVAHNQMKPLTHAFWPLIQIRGCDPNAVVRGFFHCVDCSRTPYVNKHPCLWWRGRKADRLDFKHKEGLRAHEGSAPSDKRVIGLMTKLCRQKSDPINKAAEQHKENPCWTPNRWTLDLAPSPRLVIIV